MQRHEAVPEFELDVGAVSRWSSSMLLVRYFLFVGGVLLTLVFTLDAWLTELPVMERSHANSSVVRIHSDRKWPERIVFDTTLPAIVPAQTAIVEDRVPVPSTVTDIARKQREREAFALMQPSDAKRLETSAPGRRELKPQRQRKIVKRHAMPRSLFVARQPQFGWFGNTIWR